MSLPLSVSSYKFDPKPAGASDLFFFDWTDWCKTIDGDTLASNATTITASSTTGTTLAISEIAIENQTVVRCRISGGTANVTYSVTCTVTSTPSARLDMVTASLYITR